MERYFNTEGLCEPDKHYMVPLDERLKLIRKRYVERGSYFVINRGRQYGKTTTLKALADYLSSDYVVISMDFQRIGNACFEDEREFTGAFVRQLSKCLKEQKELQACLEEANLDRGVTMDILFDTLCELCRISEKPIVLMIDEIDSASNNQVFLDFLAMIRGFYLARDEFPFFHNVILAGVYDIKNLKQKIRPEEEHKYNSPWNIAAKFDVAMGFSAEQIGAMLREYEEDHHTGMNIRAVAEEIYAYTSGYPYLVSAICKLIDEELPYREGERYTDSWSRTGVEEAVKIILSRSAPLFESMVKQFDRFPELREMLESIIYRGAKIPYNPYVESIGLGAMFGYLKDDNGKVAVANRMFEMTLLNLFITEENSRNDAFRYGDREQSRFVRDGRLDMDLVMEKFVEYYTDICGHNDEKFLEDNGRKMFLLYLKPIINGTGNYYIEAQTRDARRTDVIVDYGGEQFIVELKIWRGNEYNERGEGQIADYLDYYHKEKGYLLSFNFNKNKEVGMKQVQVGEKTVVEAVV